MMMAHDGYIMVMINDNCNIVSNDSSFDSVTVMLFIQWCWCLWFSNKGYNHLDLYKVFLNDDDDDDDDD